ncbi:MAG: 23S rRNA (pseudouridine(1915)-N(3))-methyltransferase RlmH [Deltaproteobacteria bacterium]|nr:23S rRNA (pseudouridine(1915)-N(3))-methyltransferase RlmH [Deltaproteobacteria bacterium]
MKILLLTIGKIKSKPLLELVNDYSERIGHYTTLEMASAVDERSALMKLQPNDFLIVCDERGKQKTSKGMSDFVKEHQLRGTKRLVFFIGDAEGNSSRARDRAHLLLALSLMTLPHEMATVLLLEQLYRAFTIIKGEPYHK